MNTGLETVSLLATRIAIARAAARIGEVGGNNLGPEPQRYNEQVGLPKGGAYPWCCSGMYDVFLEASRILGVDCPFPKTAKAVRVWERMLAAGCGESMPRVGSLYILAHAPAADLLRQWRDDRYTADGHIGIVTALDDDGLVVRDEVSGNTKATTGSREGNCWAMHHGPPEVSHGGMLLGFINLERVVVYPPAAD